MKIALVHDYLKEFGGAERVLRVLSDMYPSATIYTAFAVSNSSAMKRFCDRKVVESKWAFLLKRKNLYSPLRFLAPLVWRSIDLRDYDLVITSCSSYFARGFRVSPKTKVIAYCHTPPRFLYGYQTSVNLMKYQVVRMYSFVVNHFLRVFDAWSAERVDRWLVNSKNVAERVWKFYRKKSEVVYPPVEVTKMKKDGKDIKKSDYFLIVSRLVGAKGLEEASRAVVRSGNRIVIVGEAVGFSPVRIALEKIEGVELVGAVDDTQLVKLYSEAKGFLALARQEDFGMTVVESMACGTGVIAFRGGGFLESVVEGVNGVFVDDTDEESLGKAIDEYLKRKWDKKKIQESVMKFDREVFENKVRKVVKEYAGVTRG